MPSIVNVHFKVTRVNHDGNRSEPYSRLFSLESIDFDQPFKNLSASLYYIIDARFTRFIEDVEKEVLEIKKNEGSTTKSKLVYPDEEGDYILVQNASALYAIIQRNKTKCLAGQLIPLYVLDFSQSTGNTIVSPTDSKKPDDRETITDTISKQLTDLGSLYQNLQMGQESIVKLLIATSDQTKRENSAALKASMEIMETQMKEQSDEIKQVLANIPALLNDSLSREGTKDLAMQLWNEWTQKIRPQQQVVIVEEPKPDSILIESNLNGEEESSVVTQENYPLEEVD